MAWVLCAMLCGANGGPSALDLGTKANDEFHADQALGHLESARRNPPHTHADHVRLYEQLGISYAYLGKTELAMAAFDMLLALEPTRALRYTLSPKVTFVFEQVRRATASRPAPSIDVSWPRDLLATAPCPIDTEVVADPKGFLHTLVLYHRLRGESAFHEQRVLLAGQHGYQRTVLDPATSELDTASVRELYAVVVDAAGNEVLRWARAEQPRELPAAAAVSTPWFKRWWLWAAAVAVVAAGVGVAVYAVTRRPSFVATGSFSLEQ